VAGLIWILHALEVPLQSINQTILNTMIASLIYIITLVIVTVVPLIVNKHRTDRTDIGLTRLPQWSDILLTPAGLIAYLIFSSLLILLATRVLPGFDVNQVQSTGFGHLNQRYEYILAFTTLVVVAPIAEDFVSRVLVWQIKKVCASMGGYNRNELIIWSNSWCLEYRPRYIRTQRDIVFTS